MNTLPPVVENEEHLDQLLSTPSPSLVEMMQRLEGDILILGVGGKMGVSLGALAVKASKAAGIRRNVYGVSRFSDSAARDHLERQGVKTIPCDLLDRKALDQLPEAANIVYMVGRKFGTAGQESLTWATNVLVPSHVSDRFQESRIVAFSTGGVYPLVSVATGGCTESVRPDPIGEYGQSCLGRERVFEYWSRTAGIPICLIRLNYAVDLRYGVLYDIGRRVFESQPLDLVASHVNVIWQGDANEQALRCLETCAVPPEIINVTGPETVSVRFIAETFAQIFDKEVQFIEKVDEPRMYLSNASKATARFGYPRVPLLTLIRWQAGWISRGERSLGKPTHFEVTNGRF